jgi:hypothetical protein
MEQAQLFKHLYHMSMDEINLFIDSDEPIEKALYKLDMAARTRHIIHAVQLEDLWRALDEHAKTYDLYLSMRLAPMTLQSCYHLNHDMNSLEWRFVFPAIKEISHDVRPKTFGEYLALNKNVQIIDIEQYDIDIACAFLDKAYDFTPHKLRQAARPVNPRQQGGASQ